MASTEVLVLVVKDELLILGSLKHALESAGYGVTAVSSEDAMTLAKSKIREFAAFVVVDITGDGAKESEASGFSLRELTPCAGAIRYGYSSAGAWVSNGVDAELP